MILSFYIFLDSVMCYVGQVLKFPMAEKLNPGNVSLSRCPGTTKCITVDYTMLTYGLHIPVVQGICGINVLACDMFCDYIKRGISGFTEISSCKVSLRGIFTTLSTI